MPLAYVSSPLDKNDSSSWGKYTYTQSGESTDIEWYYNEIDSTHEWIIRYRVYGALEFQNEFDRLYWNVFTDYDVPVGEASVVVLLPEGVDALPDIEAVSYREASGLEHVVEVEKAGSAVFFQTAGIFRGEDFTIDIAWPRGYIDRGAYWKDFLLYNIAYILSVILVFLTVIGIFIRWFLAEKYKKGRGTIVPHYEPPENLRPAMAEVIVKEKITSKAWPATVVDLAVRGYLKIVEEEVTGWQIAGRVLLFLPVVFLIGIFLFTALTVKDIWEFAPFTALAIAIAALLFMFLRSGIKESSWKKAFAPKNYRIDLLKQEYKNDPALEDYEKVFLASLFREKRFFLTKEVKRSPRLRKKLYYAMELVKQMLYEETEKDTRAYAVGLTRERLLTSVIAFVPTVIFIFIIFSTDVPTLWAGDALLGSVLVLLVVSFLCALAWYLFARYEARLNERGFRLREDWLGFKLYLKTAERYRMQNLTPEMFEKYLPYAIIFGVEKEWGRAFESLHMAPPSWYGGAGAAHFASSASGGAPGGFSAGAFSASFSSSFSSAFSSSGAGGGAGGGGAGGGGGGGGGGAS